MADEPKDELIDFPDYPPMDETGTVDLWQVESNLAMSPTERIRRHDEFREFTLLVRAAGLKHALHAGNDTSAA